MIEMSLSYIRIIDLRAEGEIAIRETGCHPRRTPQGVIIFCMVSKRSPRA